MWAIEKVLSGKIIKIKFDTAHKKVSLAETN